MWGYTPDKIVIASVPSVATSGESEAERQRRLHHERDSRDDGTSDDYDPSQFQQSWERAMYRYRMELSEDADYLAMRKHERSQQEEYGYDRPDREDARERDRFQNPYDEPRDDYDPVEDMHERWSRATAGGD